MFDIFLNLLTSTEEEAFCYIQSVDKTDLNKLDKNGKSFLLLILEMYFSFSLLVIIFILQILVIVNERNFNLYLS